MTIQAHGQVIDATTGDASSEPDVLASIWFQPTESSREEAFSRLLGHAQIHGNPEATRKIEEIAARPVEKWTIDHVCNVVYCELPGPDPMVSLMTIFDSVYVPRETRAALQSLAAEYDIGVGDILAEIAMRTPVEAFREAARAATRRNIGCEECNHQIRELARALGDD